MKPADLSISPSAFRPEQGEFQFYPTPFDLVIRLIAGYRHYRGICLEPHAGRGDIADRLRDYGNLKVMCCELSEDLRRILLDKGHNVIGSDFLALVAPYQFDLIVMNPPFRHAAKHILHAWSMLAPGGELAAILPQTAIGKTEGDYLELNLLIDTAGKVEEVGTAFSKAERVTNVPCVIVRLIKPNQEKFEPFSNFKPAEDAPEPEPEIRDLPASRDLIRAIVEQYNAAMRALRVAHNADVEFRRLVPDSVFHWKDQPKLTERIENVKEAFWSLIFQRTRIGELTTSSYRQKFMEKQALLSRMEFSERTIYEVLHTFMESRNIILNECVLDLFKQITYYSRDNAIEDQRWATNKGWKINPKIIVPGALDVWFDWKLVSRKEDFLNDLDKVLSMFGNDKGVCTAKEVREVLDHIRQGQTHYQQKFETSNFSFRVFKKGTIHLWFKDLKTLEMINKYAAERNMFILGSGR